MNKKSFIILFLFCSFSFIYSLECIQIFAVKPNTTIRNSIYSENDIRKYPDLCIRIFSNSDIREIYSLIINSKLYNKDILDKHPNTIMVLDFLLKENLEAKEQFTNILENWYFQEYEEVDTYIFNKFYFYKKGEDIYYKTPIELLEKYFF